MTYPALRQEWSTFDPGGGDPPEWLHNPPCGEVDEVTGAVCELPAGHTWDQGRHLEKRDGTIVEWDGQRDYILVLSTHLHTYKRMCCEDQRRMGRVTSWQSTFAAAFSGVDPLWPGHTVVDES